MTHRLFLGLLMPCLCAALMLAVPLPAPAFASSGGGGHGGGASKGDNKSKSKKKDAATITGGMFEGDPVFLNFPPFVLPIINKYGAQQIISLIVNVQVKDRLTAEEVQKTMPKVKDVIFERLYTGLSDGSLMKGQALDIGAIKGAIQDAINAHFKKDIAIDVLLPAMAQRKL